MFSAPLGVDTMLSGAGDINSLRIRSPLRESTEWIKSTRKTKSEGCRVQTAAKRIVWSGASRLAVRPLSQKSHVQYPVGVDRAARARRRMSMVAGITGAGFV